MITVKADTKSLLRIRETLDLLTLKPQQRKRILNSLGKYQTKATKKNIREQRTPEGNHWKKRKRGKAKMMKGLQRKVKFRQQNNNRELIVGWLGFSGYVAYRHHFGNRQKSSVKAKLIENKKKKKDGSEHNKDDPATRIQAKLLRELGYRMPPEKGSKKGKKGRKPTIKWITQNLTVGRASYQIRKLRERDPAEYWDVEVPERRLIGVSPKRVAMIIKREMQRNRSN
ncbi:MULTISPECIES: phage virion morphogenesis protein [unclassified Vibrio]|uniref:phage virion morphogenesis protein n=1 Tax=unclassified Vibrio TaxID=2614977 RepID=UPI0014838996|nr:MULTISPECIES: phage virion morphogenesis protein [unclassified Vibrio]MDQ2192164.1 phage virion morphogenesis protein [Vibrio sp. A14(2019)]MDQ2196314.1 phage virion morphogenesis protein [Vibrio sp. 2017_1457_11]NNN75640.1 phage virion morphogenesis protein [Vibrio sp. B7]NNN92430.1 phage virion morphogenesis protein [Vibrio sp. B8-1]NNO07730.1 phage virion morphogenesis protein [Vibrio sp. B4-12]